ncbi:MAG: rhodanese-like domain-containing protein [Propionibacteriaceae bacterium]|nr:rhodanese-like domain-containing protein [Propionibacteriaceae bacterium]
MASNQVARQKIFRGFTQILAGITLTIGMLWLSGCSTPANIEVAGATIIDVRTSAEYAAGHIQGAVNIDVQAADFATKIDALPKDGYYIVYCRSGGRSAAAARTMNSASFTNVKDAGGMENAAKALNLPIVT